MFPRMLVLLLLLLHNFADTAAAAAAAAAAINTRQQAGVDNMNTGELHVEQTQKEGREGHQRPYYSMRNFCAANRMAAAHSWWLPRLVV
ncbi:hypothetical protein E2C01_094978 [Portunus trituberculatus]|uniref:Secreted protein n=1 Tax=Portunus trituberculatus TaxID=210409 RepID=A0A5B7K2C7_PORTR|nr:hypothetical protein [Portunus trituberculatus]